MNPIKDTLKDITSMLTLDGIVLILFAVLIFIFPALLSYLVAAFLSIAGISLLVYGFKINKSYKEAEKFWKKLEE